MSTRLAFAVLIRTWHATLKSSSLDVGAVFAVIWVAATSSPATQIRYGIAAFKLSERRDIAVRGHYRDI